MRPVDQQRERPDDHAAEMPHVRRPRRQELAPWSPHQPTDDGLGAAATPPDGTTAVADAGDGSGEAATAAGRRRRVRRGMAWVLIGGVGLYLVTLALGLAGVLYLGRLSPPGLDRLARPSGSTSLVTDDDGNVESTSDASTGSAVPESTEPADATTPTADGSTATSGADGTAGDPGTTSPGETEASVTTAGESPPPATGEAPTTTDSTTTTEQSDPDTTSPSVTHPHGGPPGGPPDKP